jgi:hypothetical protein
VAGAGVEPEGDLKKLLIFNCIGQCNYYVKTTCRFAFYDYTLLELEEEDVVVYFLFFVSCFEREINRAIFLRPKTLGMRT